MWRERSRFINVVLIATLGVLVSAASTTAEVRVRFGSHACRAQLYRTKAQLYQTNLSFSLKFSVGNEKGGESVVAHARGVGISRAQGKAWPELTAAPEA